MKRFVLLGALGLVCAGCGQYAGVRDAQPGVAAPAVAQSPVAQVTVPGPGGDIPESPPPGAVSGNAAPTPSHHGTRAGHSRAHSASKGSGYQGSAKAGSQGRRGSRPSPPAGSSQQASHISKITRSYARHNATVLPAGFPFTICPVQGQYTYSDDFGAPRCVSNEAYCGGYHLHMGNDMLSARGTPIVAPFAGDAVNVTNTVGGNAVAVYGAQGYVYNAHLTAFGILGQVRAGTVVGFVGNTGDASGGPTHDHFEWHPKLMPAGLWRSAYGQTEINGAIDPYPYLRVVCPPN